MSSGETPPHAHERGSLLRGAGLVVAVALGALGVVLMIKADSTKYVQIGAIVAFWGLLLGSFVVYGVRRSVESADAGHGGADAPRGELELRSRATGVESARDVAARREAEARLQDLLSREIREAVNREIGGLRAEIGSLRTELLDKVGGQMRLEHIETTRVIGSDLEALQDEIRAMKSAARDPNRGRRPAVLDAAVVERETSQRAVVGAMSPAPAQPPAPARPPATAPVRLDKPARPSAAPAAQQPVAAGDPPAPAARPAAAQKPPQRAATPSEPARPTAPGPADDDPFADLPRLTPFVDDDAPLPGEPNPAQQAGAQPTYVRPPAAPPAPPSYEGRRRRGDAAAEPPATVEGRPGVPAAQTDRSGRRRRAEETSDESLLSQLLDRERH